MKKKYVMVILLIIIIFVLSIIIYYKKVHINENNHQEKENIAKSDLKLKYNNPLVPKGFKEVETEEASWKLENGVPKGWNNGLVIEDDIGNQFVWVPVMEMELNKEHFKIQENLLMDEEQSREKEQIEKYGGFYIARYEAGVSTEFQNNIENISEITNDKQGVPVSKKDAIVWNYISLKNAKINATKMYKNDNVSSDLITTRQWLKVINWVEEAGLNIKNATDWGNFSNCNFKFTGYYSTDFGKSYAYGENKLKSYYNMILSAGASERNKSNNIYDLAGNLIEFTDGYVKGRGYYSVGGHYEDTGSYGIYNPSLLGVVPLGKLGFRVVLYLK